MKKKYLFLAAFSFYINLTFGQTLKRAIEFNSTERCLYDFLTNSNVIVKSNNIKDSFYILEKDSLFMFKSYLKKNDTTQIQVRLVHNDKNKTQICSSKNWRIESIEYVINGKTQLNPVFNYKKYFDDFDAFSSDFAAVKKNTKWGLINGFGEIVIPIEFEKIKPHAFGIWVKKNNQAKIFSIENNTQSSFFDEIGITAPKFEPSGLRLTGVKKNGKSSMMNSNFQLIAPLIYDNLTILGQRFLIGYRLKKVVLIDLKNGKEITKLYDKVRLSNNPNFLETSIEINGKVVFEKVDINGKAVE